MRGYFNLYAAHINMFIVFLIDGEKITMTSATGILDRRW